MRNEKSHIKISFRLRIIAWGLQDRLQFFERQAPVKIVFLILNDELFWILLSKIAIALPYLLDDWDSCNALAASYANLSEQFHTEELVLKLIFDDNERGLFRFQVGCQPFSSSNFVSRGSSNNKNLVAPAPPAVGFQKHHKPPQCLIWAVNHKFSLHFSSVRRRLTAIFNSNLTTWGKYFGVSYTVCCVLMHSSKPCPLINCKGHRTSEKIFLRWNDKIVVNEKQFITTEPTRIHTRDGRVQNGNLRYTIRPIEDAIHYFHERQGLRH